MPLRPTGAAARQRHVRRQGPSASRKISAWPRRRDAPVPGRRHAESDRDIAERLGAHAQMVELLISDDSIRIMAADPRAGEARAVQLQGWRRHAHAGCFPGARQLGRGAQPRRRYRPTWRPRNGSGELEKRVLADHKAPDAAVDQLILEGQGVSSRQRQGAHPDRPSLAAQDRISGFRALGRGRETGGRGGSGLFINGKPVEMSPGDDGESGLHAFDPAVVIPACTRLCSRLQRHRA